MPERPHNRYETKQLAESSAAYLLETGRWELIHSQNSKYPGFPWFVRRVGSTET